MEESENKLPPGWMAFVMKGDGQNGELFRKWRIGELRLVGGESAERRVGEGMVLELTADEEKPEERLAA